MQFEYLEMQGAGNRILVVDERGSGRPPPGPAQILRLGEVLSAPRFDQLMWVLPARHDGHAASYRVFNADGSEVEQCGNGVRCVARMLAMSSTDTVFMLDSPAGPVEARLQGDSVSVSMGTPSFEPKNVPFVAENAAKCYQIDANGAEMSVSVLSMGNPHCVLEVDDVTAAPVASLGPLLETHPRFPSRTNVGFLQLVARDEINLRVWERGVGETRACGTGACAAMVAMKRTDRVADDVRVNLPGGQLVVSWRRPADPVWLTGNAERIREGTIDL
ncbi:MAG: diaminopimelate epimerase [Gammaproteobacteria bacterium]|nr:diaminopimelate epimerase [Gammaproteobacteria bacterium]